MPNYKIFQGDNVVIINAEKLRSTEFGQLILIDIDGNTLAVIPKENLVVQVEDSTEIQSKIQEIIEDLSKVGFSDMEQKNPNFKEYEFAMHLKRQYLLAYFNEKLKEFKQSI